MNDEPLFALFRRFKRRWAKDAMAGLSQAEVDEINAVLASMRGGGPTTPETPVPTPGGATARPQGRRVSKAAVDLMHSFEGCKLTAYPDPGSVDGNPWTIGWGSTGPDVRRGVTWTQAQADARFLTDLAKFEQGVTRLIGSAPTNQNQFDALVCLAYNIGLDEDADTKAEGLGDSTLLRKHKAGDFEGAANAFASWRFNDGREMRGLVRRRAAEAKLYRSGT